MRYIRPPATDLAPVLERTQLWLKYADENPGYGVWIIETMESRQFVGYAVLRHVDFQPDREIEVGYTLAEASWGKGYATEATLALMGYALQQFGIKDFVAYTDALNLASNRVLEKCGFSQIGTENIYGAECLKWGVEDFGPIKA